MSELDLTRYEGCSDDPWSNVLSGPLTEDARKANLRLLFDAPKLLSEVQRLQDREKRCPTMDEAEKRSLVRAIQLIAEAVGLTIDNSPREVVETVQRLQTELAAARGEISDLTWSSNAIVNDWHRCKVELAAAREDFDGMVDDYEDMRREKNALESVAKCRSLEASQRLAERDKAQAEAARLRDLNTTLLQNMKEISDLLKGDKP